VVAKIGPYRFVRHPFYLANALVDAGIAVMSGWWVLDALLPVWWLAVYLPVIRKEENYLIGAFGADYEQYRRQVPCLIPWRRPLPRAAGGFRWDNPNITEDGAVRRSLKLLAYPLLFFACMHLRADGLAFFADSAQLAVLVVLGLWYGLASRRWRPARSVFSPAGQS
jgi:protein-S-isoprenylcysteine O-methyltransferase Ste14